MEPHELGGKAGDQRVGDRHGRHALIFRRDDPGVSLAASAVVAAIDVPIKSSRGIATTAARPCDRRTRGRRLRQIEGQGSVFERGDDVVRGRIQASDADRAERHDGGRRHHQREHDRQRGGPDRGRAKDRTPTQARGE